MGAYSRYEITGDTESRRAFRNFIELLRDTRSYATAGTCDGERWQAPGRLERIIVSTETQETCTQVNFERLANAAVASFGEAEARDWADYSERASLHGPVGLQRKPGELLYTTPLGVGVSKGRSGHGWGRPDAAFWCCYGTGVEALARLQDGVFWRLEAGATVPGDDTSSTTATDVVYIARVTTSAVATWDEKGVTTRVSVDPFNAHRGPVQREGGGDGGRRRRGTAGFFASAVAITVDAEGRKEPTSIRVKLPRWAGGGSRITLNGERVRCENGGDSSSSEDSDSDSGWCDVTRVWRKTDLLRASFPLVVRAEPLLGSELTPGFGTGSNQRLDGKGARHAIVAGPYVLAALGPGAWIADLGVKRPAQETEGHSHSGGFHAGASEISSDDVSLLETPDPTECDRVAFALAGGGDRTRYLAAVVARSDGTLPGDPPTDGGGGGVHRGGPYARAAAVFAEPDLEPTLEESKPGGSGFFYAPRTCDRTSCAYAVADAPAVTWTRCAVSSTNGERGGGGGGGGGIVRGGAFTLQPTTAPGLSLKAGVVRDGRASVVLEASTGSSTTTRPLALRLEAVDGTLGTHRVVVNDGELKGYALCRDAGSALDSPGACKDLHEKCPTWASQAACFANQGYMHAHCARSCGLCRPGGAVLVRPGGVGDGAECGVTIVREEEGRRKSAEGRGVCCRGGRRAGVTSGEGRIRGGCRVCCSRRCTRCATRCTRCTSGSRDELGRTRRQHDPLSN